VLEKNLEAQVQRLIEECPRKDLPAFFGALAQRLMTLTNTSVVDREFNTVLNSSRARRRGAGDPQATGTDTDAIRQPHWRHLCNSQPLGDGGCGHHQADGPAHTDGVGARATSEADYPMTYREAAAFLRVSPSYIETLVRQGKLPAVTLPGTDKGSGADRRRRQGRQKRVMLSALRALLMVEG
jgi:excisionase family DNA binding protein